MGFLDKALDFGGSALGGGGGFNPVASAWNAREARRDRKWRANQRATAYQTAVADLEAAGLNPILAASQGPTQTPGAGPTGTAVASASSQTRAEKQQSKAGTALNKEQVNTQKAQQQTFNSQTNLNNTTAMKVATEKLLLDLEQPLKSHIANIYSGPLGYNLALSHQTLGSGPVGNSARAALVAGKAAKDYIASRPKNPTRGKLQKEAARRKPPKRKTNRKSLRDAYKH